MNFVRYFSCKTPFFPLKQVFIEARFFVKAGYVLCHQYYKTFYMELENLDNGNISQEMVSAKSLNIQTLRLNIEHFIHVVNTCKEVMI